MTKLCPIIKTVTCGPACAWFCEDVDACSIWKIAEGLTALMAMASGFIETAKKGLDTLVQNIEKIQTLENIGLDSEEDIKKRI